MNKQELFDWVKRKLGYPMVRVELHESQLDDCVGKARNEFIGWAAGNATEECFFTLELSAGVDEYVLPSGVKEIIKVKQFDTAGGGINTLFSAQNYMYNAGYLSFIDNLGRGGSFVDYHMALNFIDMMDRYFPDKYTWWYNNHTNKLSIRPTPELYEPGPGYIMLRSFMLKGTDEHTTGPLTDEHYNFIYNKTWIQDYTLAEAKITLGYIRRKFANFQSIGNTGISLDGDSLISEGQQEKEKLMEDLRVEEDYHGWPIIMS